MAADEKLAKIMSNYIGHATSSPSTTSQIASVEALNGPQDKIEEMRKVFEQRRNYIVESVNAIEGLSCRKPDGAFYIMVNIEKQIGRTLGEMKINNSGDFSLAFLESGLVAVVSCTDFGCDNFVRLTYAASEKSIEEGMKRLADFVK